MKEKLDEINTLIEEITETAQQELDQIVKIQERINQFKKEMEPIIAEREERNNKLIDC